MAQCYYSYYETKFFEQGDRGVEQGPIHLSPGQIMSYDKQHNGCGHTWAFFYYSKVEFTTVNMFSNVTGFSHFTIVNTDLVCCSGNGGRMKAKFTIINFPKTIRFIADISKL